MKKLVISLLIVFAMFKGIAQSTVATPEQIQTFLKNHSQFKVIPYAEQWKAKLGSQPPTSADGRTDTLQLSPHSHGTDGFFVAVMQRMS